MYFVKAMCISKELDTRACICGAVVTENIVECGVPTENPPMIFKSIVFYLKSLFSL